FILTVVGYWGVGFPVAVLLCYEGGLGLHGLWYGLTAGLMAAALSLTVRYLWIERRGIERLER
ncbi:MAG: MATE family efflux transporter, partial [Deltaproteobacteria bacterium]|nr:MATE family efflux transporter [Deltaproteobacteria bacterium]